MKKPLHTPLTSFLHLFGGVWRKDAGIALPGKQTIDERA